MRILSMTATFGRLNRDTLTLQPGLNVISAPNEWGKSTWCAFLCAMLYGVDTRAKSTKTALADKERYRPWSGAAMAGEMRLEWKGRDITIQRSTRGRVPLGVFRAFETESGLNVPELTAENCGETLLGVEKSVFSRTCFIRFGDLPVTQDEALRRRLNTLVTTGDDSGEADRLSDALRELKNHCRYNRSGLLPQAESQKSALEDRLRDLEALEREERTLRQRIGETAAWRQSLQNHTEAIRFEEAQSDAAKVAQAQEEYEQTAERLEKLERRCAASPSREEAEEKVRLLRQLCQQLGSLHVEEQMLPPPPEMPEAPAPFSGMEPEEAAAMAQRDREQYEALKKRAWLVPLLLGGFAAVPGGVLMLVHRTVPGAALLLLALAGLIMGLLRRDRQGKSRQALCQKYRGIDPDAWEERAGAYGTAMASYRDALARFRASRRDLNSRMETLNVGRESLCGSQDPEEALACWQRTAAQWDEYYNARRDIQRAENHLSSLKSMARRAQPPMLPDKLAYSREETRQLLAEAEKEEQRLRTRLGQYQGRMEALGDKSALGAALDTVEARIRRLEEYEQALSLALGTLADASAELHRRFAPQITRRTQELMGVMTDGRYRRLTLGEDLSLLAEAESEDTLRETLWRSDGTVDQLYLSLRLASAEALTPEAPLVLDDALVRFDDQRLSAAMDVLKEISAARQVILFTCQSRERE